MPSSTLLFTSAPAADAASPSSPESSLKAKQASDASKPSRMPSRSISRGVMSLGTDGDSSSAKRRIPWYLVDPRKSKWLGHWDILVALALVFTAVVTPFEVAFLETSIDALFVINCLVDVTFILDMGLQFILIVPRATGAKTIVGGVNDAYLTDIRSITDAYLRTWFPIDLISCLVGTFGYLAVADDGSGDIGRLKALRVLRALRLIKLVRLIRASRIIQRWETQIAINYSLLSLLQNGFFILLMSHWMACVWTLQTKLVDDPLTSWVGAQELCEPRTLPHPPPIESGLTAESNMSCASIGLIYANAVYWAVMTITSIGYGDISASSNNILELTVATILMLASGLLWAQTVGAFCGIVTTLRPDVAAFRTTMDKLNRYMAGEEFPTPLRHRLREYFHHQRVIRSAEAQRELLVNMSPALQGEVAWQVHNAWLSSVSFLRGAQRQFLVEISVNLHAMVFAPGDLAPPGFLYIVYDGLMLIRGSIRGKGHVWGEDMILQSIWLRSRSAARAMNFCAVFHLDRNVLLSVAERYPKTQKVLRRYATLVALRRQIILEARIKLAAADKKNGFQSANGKGDKGKRRACSALGSDQADAFSQMLHNATSIPAEQTVTPMLGNSAEAAMNVASLAATAKHVVDQGDQLRQVQAQLGAMERAIAAIAGTLQVQVGTRQTAVDGVPAQSAMGTSPLASKLPTGLWA